MAQCNRLNCNILLLIQKCHNTVHHDLFHKAINTTAKGFNKNHVNLNGIENVIMLLCVIYKMLHCHKMTNELILKDYPG